MELVMTIGDITIVPNIGFVIVGGNPYITKDDTSRLCKRGEYIFIEKEKEKLVFKVLDIKLSYSISEKVIISMHLNESDDLRKIEIGDKVYKKL